MIKKKNKASALAVSLIILGVIIVIAISVTTVSIRERKGSVGTSQSTIAFQNADSGIEDMLQKIKSSAGTIADVDDDGNCNGIYEPPGIDYKIELRNLSGNLVSGCGTPISDLKSIKSTGTSSQASRAIEVGL